MKRILVLGGLESDDAPQTDYVSGFSGLMPEYSFKEVRFDHLVFALESGLFSITDGRDGEELSSYDLILFRGKIRRSNGLAYMVSRYCLVHKLPFANDYSNYRPSSKLAQAALFYEQSVPFISTYHAENPQMLVKAVGENLNYPIILKDMFGAHGRNNYLVKDEAELQAILRDQPDIKFIAQRYVKNDGDYRVLVMGDLEPLQIWRSAAGESHLNNTSQGGTGTLVDDLPSDLIAASRRVAGQLKMGIAGVDIVRAAGSDEHYFLEVNSQPQLLTGAFVGDKTAMLKRYVEKLIR